MKEAGINAKQSGDRGITAKNVKKVTEARLPFMFVNGTSVANNYQSTLHKFKG